MCARRACVKGRGMMGTYKSVVMTLMLMLGLSGLVAAAAPKADELVGQWRATQGDPKEAGGFYSVMALELKKDGTAALTTTMPNLADRSKQVINKATGKWKLEGDKVNLTLEKGEDGKEIPEDQRKLPLTVAADGKSLTNPDLGEVAFKKRPKGEK